MPGWLARIRGALGTGLTWAVGWLGAGVSLWLGFFLAGWPVEVLEFAVLFSATGLVSGTAFAGMLSLAERKRRLEELSLRRFAGWGAVAGLAVSLGVSAALGGTLPGLIIYVGTLTALGASSAAGSLVIARRADRELMSATEAAGPLAGD